MKAAGVLFLFFIIATSLSAQQAEKKNPDGQCVSIHITPKINSVLYEANDGKSSYNSGDQFNLDFKIKFPWSKNITTTIFTENFSLQYNNNINPTKPIYYKQRTWGMTLSIYLQ